MRKHFAGLTLCAALAAGFAAAAGEPEVGKAAPEIAAIDSHGKRVALSDLRGKLVVLEWTNHQCPYVRKHYGAANMQKTQQAAREAGAVWLSIISSGPGEQGFVSPAQANELTAARRAQPSHVLLDPDGTAGRAYGARVTPTMAIIGRNGTLLYLGAIDSIPTARADDIARARNHVLAALDEIAAGKKVSEPTTRAYGCVIHYKESS
jgi:peroxiredoxin